MSGQKKGNKAAGTANKTKDSVVKVIVKADDVGEWIRPESLGKFYIDEEANFPSIPFEIKTDQPGPYKWSWSIRWEANVSGLFERKRGKCVATFPRPGEEIETKGKFSQAEKTWDAQKIGRAIGGKLTVTVEAGTEKFKRTVLILGKAPSKERIDDYVEQKVKSGSKEKKISFSTERDNDQDRATAIATMKKILQQESGYKQFLNFDSEPIVSFDKGYGLTQLTSGDPTYEQVWNWKAHMDEALARMVKHRASSVRHFNEQRNWYHDDAMVEINAISLWNGGHYYTEDFVNKKWVRNPKIICVPDQGNRGYKLKDDEIGKKKLGDMLKDKERKPVFVGVCYADTIANK